MLCCVCLLETPKMLGIFDDKGKQLCIADVIEKHFWFKIHPEDSLKSQVCTICWTKTEDFHKFYQSVENSHKLFHHKLITTIKEEEIKQEEQLVENTYEDNIALIPIVIKEVAEKDAVETVQKNPLENENFNSDYNEDEDIENEDSITSDVYEPSEKSETEDIENKKKLENCRKKGIKKKVKNKNSNPTKKDEIHKKKRSSHSLDPVITEQLIKKHIPMLCDLCVFTGNTFSDIVGHFKGHHSKEQPYIMCCNRKFTRSYCIDQHAIIHENPDSFRCNECKRSFTTTYGLRTHNLNHHSPEEKRIHACEFCPRRFGRRQLLELHRQKHIPKEDWTITCSKCTTRTVNKQYLFTFLSTAKIYLRQREHLAN